MKIHFSSSRGKTKSNFSSRISQDRDSCQGLIQITRIQRIQARKPSGNIILVMLVFVRFSLTNVHHHNLCFKTSFDLE